MDMYMILFWTGLVVTIIGVLILVMGGVSFQMRALSNKKPWDGHTRPLLGYGLLTFIIGIGIFLPGIIHLYNMA
ncbi:hypothetical protein [Bifidobacterium aquikefiri]|uniref:hypothetical protein n=2 Tax=Bifidobacterium aquikefiri TaxID=1653207 RepID=UPI0023F4B8ED|nr:hypothetical protein [Bifidobacterium aquikefiri]